MNYFSVDSYWIRDASLVMLVSYLTSKNSFQKRFLEPCRRVGKLVSCDKMEDIKKMSKSLC